MLREDNTPHFKPYDGQTTYVNGGQQNYSEYVDPCVIEMTFDRPLLTDNEGYILDINGTRLDESELFSIEVIDNEDAAATRANGPKKARPVLTSSTSKLKPGTNNVAVVTIGEPKTASSAPARIGGIKKARPVLTSSTGSVKVVAKAGAIAYDAQPKTRAASQPSCLAEEEATTAFAFGYTFTADANDSQITYGSRVDITMGDEGIMTYYATQGEWLDAESTGQLKFYKVSKLAVGSVTLEQLHGTICGPVMVKGKPGRTVTVDKGNNYTNDPSNFLRYCTEGSTIPYLYDKEYYPEDYDRPSATPQAYNYIFGRLKSSGDPIGFYHLNITSPNGWTNTTNHGIVYLHSYMNLAPDAQSHVRMLLPDGEEIGAPTAILQVNADATRTDSRLYNTLGQEVKTGYRGIVISGSKKYINK